MNVAPNTTDDQQLLAEDIENLKEGEGINDLYTDAGDIGEPSDKVTATYQGTQQMSAIMRNLFSNPFGELIP